MKALRAASVDCRGCELYREATQTVFGAGPRRASVLLVGEMPGDQEDLQGKPFVGPAGRLLDDAIASAGLLRDAVYVTNVVKHFRWEPRGKRRLHKKPSSRQIAACKPWLEAEMSLLKPPYVVCLGATAAQALLGRAFRLTSQRGVILPSEWAPHTLATHHPSAVLRTPDAGDRRRKRDELIADLSLVAKRMAHSLNGSNSPRHRKAAGPK